MINYFLTQVLKPSKKFFFLIIFLFSPLITFASSGAPPSIGPIRIEFIIFGLILLGVALFHKQTFWVAITGLSVLLLFKLIFDPGFHFMEHLFGERPIVEQLLNKELTRG